jgi:hypothetical protein
MTAEQRARHNLTHIPFHPSCEFCVAGKSPDSHHRSSSSLSREQLKSLDSTPVVSLDYWFAATRHNQQSQATILTIVDHNSGFVDAISCSKGSHEGAVTFVKAFLRQVGHVKCILQSDAEASTTALTRTVAAQLQNVFVRVAARGSHGSQGVIESKNKSCSKSA